MIIDATDFNDRPFKVPNQEESRDFISFIESKEEELAVKYLLGVELWTQFQEGLATSPPIDSIWEELRDGAVYEFYGVQYKYKGWVDLVRPAIFAEWIPQTTDKLTNIGFVQNSAPEKSKLIEDPYPYIVKHWNDFVTKVGYHASFGYNYRNSFYGFMKANDYENWIFKCPNLINRHDL